MVKKEPLIWDLQTAIFLDKEVKRAQLQELILNYLEVGVLPPQIIALVKYGAEKKYAGCLPSDDERPYLKLKEDFSAGAYNLELIWKDAAMNFTDEERRHLGITFKDKSNLAGDIAIIFLYAHGVMHEFPKKSELKA